MLSALLLGLTLVMPSTTVSRGSAHPAGPHRAESRTYRIPYRLTDTLHLLVRAKINGHGPFNFIMDTGSPALVLPDTVAKQIGVTPGSDRWASFDRLEIEGGAVLRNIKARVDEPFQLQGMNAMGLAGERIDGVLGYNILAHFRLEVDLTQPTMAWTQLDYEPSLPRSLAELTGGRKITPPKDLTAIEGLTKIAGALFAHKTETEIVERGFFGFEVADAKSGVRVASVLPQSPAADAGLQPGDRITECRLLPLPGHTLQSVHTVADLFRITTDVAPDTFVQFNLLRGKRAITRVLHTGKGGF